MMPFDSLKVDYNLEYKKSFWKWNITHFYIYLQSIKPANKCENFQIIYLGSLLVFDLINSTKQSLSSHYR